MTYVWSQEKTIPTAFVRQDTATTKAQAFVNVADRQRYNLNWNKIVACRTRQPSLHMRLTDGTDVTGAAAVFSGFQPIAADGSTGDVMVSVPVYEPHMPWINRSYDVVVYASISAAAVSAATSCELYPSFSAIVNGFETSPRIDFSKKITVNSATISRYSSTVPVPWIHGEYINFHLHVLTPPFGADIEAPVNVLNSGETWVWVSAALPVGALGTASQTVMYSPTDAEIEPRMVVAQQAITVDASTYYLVTVDRPFNKRPTTSDTVATKDGAVVEIKSLTLYPNRATG